MLKYQVALKLVYPLFSGPRVTDWDTHPQSVVVGVAPSTAVSIGSTQ